MSPISGPVTAYAPDMWAYHDYYPFGMTMMERSWQAADYRYGFQGQEKDDEVLGESTALDFGARVYDVRVVRWLSVDPLEEKYPWNSSFSLVAKGYTGFDNQNQNNPEAYFKEVLDISLFLGVVAKNGGAEKVTSFGNLMDNVAKAIDQGYEAINAATTSSPSQRDTVAFTCDYKDCRGKYFLYNNKSDIKRHTGEIRYQISDK